MKKGSCRLSFLAAVLFVLFECVYAWGFHAEVLPSEIAPGDAFLVRVSGLKGSHLPEAFLERESLHFSPCGEGCFIAIGAIGVDAKPGESRIRIIAGSREHDLIFTVVPATFPEIRITLPDEKVFLSPGNLKRVEMEDEKLKSIWKKVSVKLWEGSFVRPLGNSVSTPFGTKRIINRKKISIHRGLDIRGKKGEEVRASNRGRVVLAEELFFGGNTVVVDHGMGIYTIYMHLSEFSVKPEDIVLKGEVVGFVGSSGRASGPHLHFGVKIFRIDANPVSFFRLDL